MPIGFGWSPRRSRCNGRSSSALIDVIKYHRAQQIADLTAENTRLKICAESSTADRDTVRVAVHEALKQNYQLQNQLMEQIVKHQEQEKLNAELHFKLLEEKETAHCKRARKFHVGTPRGRVEWRSRDDRHALVTTHVDLRVRGFQRQGCSAEACWRRQQPDLDQGAARVQDGFADMK